MRLLFLTLMLIFCASAAGAEEHPCSGDNVETEGDMTACWLAQLKKAEDKMDKAVKILRTRYKDDDTSAYEWRVRNKNEPGYLATFEKAQASWKTFRDNECDYLNFESLQGTGYGTILTGCLAEQTELRAEHLSKLVDMP